MLLSFILIFLTLAIVALVDYLPRLFVASKRTVKPGASFSKTPRYLIMPTVYGDISYLQNIPFLKKYADKVVICTSRYETPKFYSDLRAVCKQYGFRYIKADLPVVKGVPIKNAYTIYAGAFANRSLLRVPNDTPCLLMDADTFSNSNVNNLMRAFVREGLDIASLRCEVAKPRKLIELLQDFEYTLAMDNRNMDPWLTSGACSVAKATVYRHVFSKHSQFFAGGDIEIGKLAQVMSYKLRHIDFTFYTAVPDTFKAWVNQRTIWFAGGFRHHVVNMGSFGWHHFFMLVYNSLIVYMLWPLRWIEMVNFPLSLLMLVALSWIYTAVLIAGKKRWHPAYLLLPFYAFVQSMLVMPRGVVRYFKIAWAQRSLGLLKYEVRTKKFATQMLYKVLNVSSAGLIIYAAILFTSTRIGYWLQHGELARMFIG